MLQLDLTVLANSLLSPAYLALTSLLAVLVYAVWSMHRQPYAENLRNLKGPGCKTWFFGSFPPGAEISGRYELELNKFGSMGRSARILRWAGSPFNVLADHRAVNKVLLQTPYSRVTVINDLVKRHVGSGLIATEGAQHRRQRRVAQPAFTQASVYRMAPTMHEKAGQMVTRLRRTLAQTAASNDEEFGSYVDITKHIFPCTLDIIGVVGFNYEFDSLLRDENSSELEKAFHGCLETIVTGTAYNLLRIALGAPVEAIGRLLGNKEQRKLDDAKSIVRAMSAQLVEKAKAEGNEGTDLLTLMVRANVSADVKDSQRLTDEELREMVPVFLFAGHETTATALSWSMMELMNANYGKQLQERLRSELTGQDVSWQSDPSKLDSLPYLDAFTRETLRYYCPVRNVPRQAPFDDVIPLSRPAEMKDGTYVNEIRVLKGQTVQFPVAMMNRDPQGLFGARAEEFLPERWLPEDHRLALPQSEGADASLCELKGVYSSLMTFGCGTQMCIGVRMAVLEFKVILAALVTSFEMLPPNLPGEPEVEIQSLDMVVSKPVLKKDPKAGLTMPVRLKCLLE
ncbi:hypothetical protein OC861_003593 [Tilletia horrida]|nr:hypothetical protein OC861_003593 [Tilletia horrida]